MFLLVFFEIKIKNTFAYHNLKTKKEEKAFKTM